MSFPFDSASVGRLGHGCLLNEMKPVMKRVHATVNKAPRVELAAREEYSRGNCVLDARPRFNRSPYLEPLCRRDVITENAFPRCLADGFLGYFWSQLKVRKVSLHEPGVWKSFRPHPPWEILVRIVSCFRVGSNSLQCLMLWINRRRLNPWTTRVRLNWHEMKI